MVMLQNDGLSKTYEIMNDSEIDFGIISAPNKRKMEDLIKDLYNSCCRFIHMAGGYLEDNKLKPDYEHCLFVYNISKKDLLTFAKKYDQNTVLYKDKTGLKYLEPDGKVKKEFKPNDLIVDGYFNLEKIKPYFNNVKEGFNLFVYEPQTLMGRHCAYLNAISESDFTYDNTSNIIDESIDIF